MKTSAVKHEFFEYKGMPLVFRKLKSDSEGMYIYQPHWHEDLEVVYTIKGRNLHYIQGKCFEGIPGRVLVVNSEFVHNTIPDPALRDHSEVVAYLVTISRPFLEKCFPQYQDIYFTNEREQASAALLGCMERIITYQEELKQNEFDYLYAQSLALELLYRLSQEGTVARNAVDRVNSLKNIERIRGVLQYVEEHYQEPLTQAEVAEKFYFSPEYFCVYFKKCTGLTFTGYVTDYRLGKAKIDLVHTDKTVYQVAMENGFTDDRRLILAFKKKYGMTPNQYRKEQREQ